MEKYEAYKDSGVQWLGEIPSHWEIRPLKSCVSQSVSGAWGDEAKGDSFDLICLRVTDFDYSHGIVRESNLTTRNYNPSLPDNKIFKEGDLLLEKSGGGDVYPVGRVVRYTLRYQKATCSNFMQKITPSKSIVPDYLYYYCFCTYHKKVNTLFFNQTTGIQNLRIPQYLSQKICLPPRPEQQAIVSYLDDKCAKLDTLVTNKEKEIELLQEMKQRVIADAVTRGLDPDVKFKETGISWLPQIPEHWISAKLKAFCKDNKEKNKGNFESKVLSLSYGRVIIKQNINFGLVPDSYETYQIVNPGYIILRLTDLQNDHKSLRTGLVKDRGIITSAYVALIVNNMDSTYVQLVLHSYDIMKVFYGMGGGLRQSMSYQDIANLYIPIPPIDEQKAIVAYIEERVTKIDTLAQKLQQEIDSIKEYKQRLISDVVTGQIKVC